jgi:competence protein ComEA
VPGVGAGLLAAIRDHVAFGDSARLLPSPGLVARSAGLVSLNSAGVEELASVPGIGRRRAEAIVRDREQRGPFASVDALSRIPGIKPALLARVRQTLQVP